MQTRIEITIKNHNEDELFDQTVWLEEHVNDFINNNEINADINVFQSELNPDDLERRKPEPIF